MKDDTISRQAVLDALADMHCKSDEDGYVWIIRIDAWARIDALPSAQPERMKGKWERHYCEDGNPDGWRCDNCDEWYYFGQTLPNFCPNCGADMRGEQE